MCTICCHQVEDEPEVEDEAEGEEVTDDDDDDQEESQQDEEEADEEPEKQVSSSLVFKCCLTLTWSFLIRSLCAHGEVRLRSFYRCLHCYSVK